jgi:hypothetical protein
MSAVTALPANLREKLAAVARRIRLWRALRGCSLFLLVVLATGGAAIAGDACFDFPPAIRAILLVLWVVLAILTAIYGLVIPVLESLDPEALAAIIEGRFPQLGERLTTTIELAGAEDEFHGSPTFMALLIDETEARTQRLNFLRAFPAGLTVWLAAGALVGILMASYLVFLRPERAWELSRRFLFALETPTIVIPYALDISPGDTVAARGRPLQFTVHVRPTEAGVALPASCTLVRTDARGLTSRSRMLADRSDRFSLKLNAVPGDFSYRVEAGEAVSSVYHVTAVEPVELAPDSPTVTVTPPEYARTAIEAERLRGCADLSALQYSQVAFAFRFTRPAIAASLEWKPARSNDRREVLPLELSPDQQEGRFALSAIADGTYRIVLEAEHGIRTETQAYGLTVKVDLPPVFVRVGGSDEIKEVQPHEVVPLAVELADDIGVDLADLEYRINNGPVVTEPMQLDGRASRQASARHSLELSGKVKEGDMVYYRFKGADNRRVPEVKLGPNVIYYPPEMSLGQPRWRTLKIARQAAPLDQQNIDAQHEDIKRRLEAIQKNLREEQGKLQQVQTDVKDLATLKPAQIRDLTDLQKQNRSVENDLRDLARDLVESPAVQLVVDGARELADEEMTRGTKALEKAQRETSAETRGGELQQASKELKNADKKLDELRRQNDQLAQARQTQAQLGALANKQQKLADRAQQQTRGDPARDMNEKATRELEREQEELSKELQRQSEQNENLRAALDAARADQAKQIAKRARDLAQAERDLVQTERERERRRQQEELADLARQQRNLAEKARRLSEETEQAVVAAKTDTLKTDDAKKAADALDGGDTKEALRRQDRVRRDSARLADDLQRAMERGRDPREAARQLARLQEDLRRRVTEEQAKKEAQEPLADRLQKLRPKQQAIHRATEQLSVPPQDSALKLDRAEAVQREDDASIALQKGDPSEAAARMLVAQQALERLANKLPSLDQRREQALEEIRKLRREQEQVARQAEKATTEAARHQEEIARRLERLDTPNEEARRDRAREALDRAAADLKEARPPQVMASQQDAGRKLQELEQSLSGTKPTLEQRAEDIAPRLPVVPRSQEAMTAGALPSSHQVDQARRLAQQQRSLQDAVQRLTQAPAVAKKTLAADQARQQELDRQTGELTRDLQRMTQQMVRIPPAQQAAEQAAQSSQRAQSAMREALKQQLQAKFTEAQQSQQQAAQALDQAARLAQQAAQQMTAAVAPLTSQWDAQAGHEIQRAETQMSEALRQLSHAQTQTAQQSMRQAAQALTEAARRLAQRQQAGDTQNTSQQNKLGALAPGQPDLRMFEKDMKKYSGKSWGELPGELRTRIIQDMQAKYGDDYARIIKLYFEQLADQKK